MKVIKFILPTIVAIAMGSCSQSTHTTNEKILTDSTKTEPDTALFAKISFPISIQFGKPVEMTFTVYNPTDSNKTFCKWHTPFEPLMSKYLDITGSAEAAYQGPMAKRIMPPPAESYVTIKPGDSLSTKVDITKGYDIRSLGTYYVNYNSENISGLKVTGAKFTIEK